MSELNFGIYFLILIFLLNYASYFLLQELATLKKTLEEDAQVHEVMVTEMRHKHSQELTALNEQLESLKKVTTESFYCYAIGIEYLL